jgi:hypothetical protein
LKRTAAMTIAISVVLGALYLPFVDAAEDPDITSDSQELARALFLTPFEGHLPDGLTILEVKDASSRSATAAELWMDLAPEFLIGEERFVLRHRIKYFIYLNDADAGADFSAITVPSTRRQLETNLRYSTECSVGSGGRFGRADVRVGQSRCDSLVGNVVVGTEYYFLADNEAQEASSAIAISAAGIAHLQEAQTVLREHGPLLKHSGPEPLPPPAALLDALLTTPIEKDELPNGFFIPEIDWGGAPWMEDEPTSTPARGELSLQAWMYRALGRVFIVIAQVDGPDFGAMHFTVFPTDATAELSFEASGRGSVVAPIAGFPTRCLIHEFLPTIPPTLEGACSVLVRNVEVQASVSLDPGSDASSRLRPTELAALAVTRLEKIRAALLDE